jgi:Fe-S-cluster-containing dehydrogenase component
MKKWLFIIDIEKCENCNNCFLSCKDEHVGNDWPGYAEPQPDEGQTWIAIEGTERGQYPLIDVAYLPTPCMHCEEAPCLRAAKDGAIYRRPDGIVLIDPVKAKGQKNLINACPYGAIRWNETLTLPQKCTFCAHLLDSGWTQTRCVQSCPTGALSLRHIEDSQIPETIEAEKLEVYQPERKTSPRVYYKNLYRYTRCFIGGSVALHLDGVEECAVGAQVTLLDKTGVAVAECSTDDFGEFKFDNLANNSGLYELRISYENRGVKTVDVNLQESLNIGVIFV